MATCSAPWRSPRSATPRGSRPSPAVSSTWLPGLARTEAAEKGTRHNHLVLLARDLTGYQNLLRLSSMAYTEGFYYKPRIDDELLIQYHEGLICLSACLAGDIPRAILDRRPGGGARAGPLLRGALRPGRVLPGGPGPRDPGAARGQSEIVRISQETGTPLVATNDIHYTQRLCIKDLLGSNGSIWSWRYSAKQDPCITNDTDSSSYGRCYACHGKVYCFS